MCTYKSFRKFPTKLTTCQLVTGRVAIRATFVAIDVNCKEALGLIGTNVEKIKRLRENKLGHLNKKYTY